ncbi:MAG: hypothetical protein DRP47_09725 [Candidatus Zixiibacteriota bacterium]|nr:MAG: hypothetical protein DRP47_09725 [candidate division Zixibacteria bacterium]
MLGAKSRWRAFTTLITCPVCGDAKGHAGVLSEGTVPLKPVELDDHKRVFPFELPIELVKVSYPEVFEFLKKKHLDKRFPLVKLVEFQGRFGLYLPIEFGGREVGFQIRFMSGKPKYFNRFPSYVLYHYDYVSPPTCVLVEGIFDTFPLPEYSLAIFGKRLSRRQLELLKLKGFRRVIVGLDADALSDAISTSRWLFAKGFDSYFLRVPRGSPGDFLREELLSFPCFDLQLRKHSLEEVLK